MLFSHLRLVLFLIVVLGATVWAPEEALTAGSRGPWVDGRARAQRLAVKAIRSDLQSPYGDKRRRTIAKLAKIGGHSAFELVLEALGDRDPEPADEAQLLLPSFEASVGTRVVVTELLGRPGLRSKDPLVRLRAAEALGRLTGPVDPKKWISRVDPKEVDVARALLTSVERMAAAGRLSGDRVAYVKALDRLLGRAVPDRVRAVAVQCVAVLDPDGWQSRRGRVAARRGLETRCSSLAAAVRVGHLLGDLESARADVRAALADDEDVVRAMAVRLLPRMGPLREDLMALAARLDGEPRIALRAQVVATLQRLTGKKHRDHAAAWAHAVAALPDDWTPDPAPGDLGEFFAGPSLADPRTSPTGEGQSAATLERLGPASDRVALLVDFSGSLWNEREDGSCRKDLLDPEMDRLLDKIEPDSHFLLIPFTGTQHPFSKSSVRARPREIKAAKRYFRKAKMRGQGNLYGAVQRALQDPTIDRILILTDGAPTGGQRWNAELMGRLMLEETRFRPVIFDFVLLDAPAPLRRAWASVAARTGGRTLCLQM